MLPAPLNGGVLGRSLDILGGWEGMEAERRKC